MDPSSPSPPARPALTYEEILLTLTDAEARVVLRLEPQEFWDWYRTVEREA